MKSPFQFGRVVVGETFTDRTTEIKRALEKKEKKGPDKKCAAEIKEGEVIGLGL
jgi:hypothetical protein